MKVLDLDMDYFLECDPTSIGESQTCRSRAGLWA